MKPDYSYQQKAIDDICKKYKTEPKSKSLLVIPTGGGKTLTAIRAVNKMLSLGTLQSTDRVYWVVHSVALCNQTQQVLIDNINWGKFLNALEECHPNLGNVIQVKMLTDATQNHVIDKPKLVIIDEAHHSAAPSYQSFFNTNYGVLGLTATPTRNDDYALDYDEIVYSITTRELINCNVIIKPIIHSHKTYQVINVSSLSEDGASKFDYLARNQFIANKVFQNRRMYKKAILYVRTREHAKNLCQMLNDYNNRMGNDYEHIGYILGGDENIQGTTNEAYLKYFKERKSALVVNCGVLTEGFDDPTIDTVVMVVPTSSIIYYLQCIGRAIRTPQNSSNNKAFVVEFEDDMPNVHYRIDNKWLFADISDVLEPQVLEKNYATFESYDQIIKDLHVEFKKEHSSLRPNNINLGELEKTNLLLYNPSKDMREDAWQYIYMHPENSTSYTRIFNALSFEVSKNIKDFKINNVNWLFDEKYTFEDPDDLFEHEFQRTNIKTAIEYAYEEKSNKEKVTRLKYFIFHKNDGIPDDFQEFIKGCKNESSLLTEYIQMKESGKASSVIKIPLSLGGFEGVYLNENGTSFCKSYLSNIESIKENEEWQLWPQAVFSQNHALTDIPISQRQLQALPTIIALHIKDYIFNL